jgi:hypothetical protein
VQVCASNFVSTTFSAKKSPVNSGDFFVALLSKRSYNKVYDKESTTMIVFKPELTPEQMLQHGVFGGGYFEKATEEDFLLMRPSIVELAMQNREPYDKAKNLYKVKAGLDYKKWLANGWLYDEDPLGWFQWYCRYDSGRRHARDSHQITRYQNYIKRWGSNASRQQRENGSASLVIRQGLLQWGVFTVK